MLSVRTLNTRVMKLFNGHITMILFKFEESSSISFLLQHLHIYIIVTSFVKFKHKFVTCYKALEHVTV